MATADQSATQLITAERFALMPGNVRSELVKGKVIELPPPGFLHGRIVIRIASLLDQFVRAKKLGWVSGAESGFVTSRSPDSVRGVDILFISKDRIPSGQFPHGHLTIPPELVIEILSPEDRWPAVLRKSAEYFDAGVNVVVIVEPELRMVYVYHENGSPVVLRATDTFSLPDILGDFAVPFAEFFE